MTVAGYDESPGLKLLFMHMCGYITKTFLDQNDDVLVKRQKDKLHLLVGELILDGSNISDEHIHEILSIYGWAPQHGYVSVAISFEASKDLVRYLGNATLRCFGKIPVRLWFDNKLSFLINLHNSVSGIHVKQKQSFSSIIENFGCKIGVSDIFYDVRDLAVQYRHAVCAIEKGIKENPLLSFFNFRNTPSII
ncbi:MAG: hypothetical protein FWG10_06095 [Eubacteriaceae bacterium]|nr:hypothetical protein [Eubacteriaceae bacterium]